MTILKYMLKYKILIKLFVLNCLFEYCVYVYIYIHNIQTHNELCWITCLNIVPLLCNYQTCTEGTVCVISGFPLEANKNCALLGCYAASSGNSLPTFRDNLSVPSSGFQDSKFLFRFGFLLLVIMQGAFVISYRRFGTNYPSHSQASRIKILI